MLQDRFVFTCAALTFACVVGCSGSTDGAPASSAAPDGASNSPDGPRAGSTETGSSSGTSGPVEEKRIGMLTLASTKSSEVERGTASGTFYRFTPPPSSSAECTTRTVGSCEIKQCTRGAASKIAVEYTNAGPVTVSGVLVDDGTMTMTPGKYGYETVRGSAAFFSGGEMVRLKADGKAGGAPAFDVSLVAPSPVQVTSPVFDDGAHVKTAAGQGLDVAWTGSAGGVVVAELFAGTAEKSAGAVCRFQGDAGQGTVPSDAVTAVRAIDGVLRNFSISVESRITQQREGWDLTFSLYAEGVQATPSGGTPTSGWLAD